MNAWNDTEPIFYAPDQPSGSSEESSDMERSRRERVDGVRAVAGIGGVENVFAPHLDGEREPRSD